MLLCLDILATHAPDLSAAPDAGHQPRPVRVMAAHYGLDMVELGRLNVIIRPENWKVPADCGVTQLQAERFGAPARAPLPVLRAWTDVSTVVIAHGLERVDALLQVWRAFCKGTPEWIRPRMTKICTARLSAPLCKLPTPGSLFADHYRLPTVEEATEAMTGEAASGIEGIMKLYTTLREKRMLEAAA